MRVPAVIATLVAVVSCSSLQFTAVPRSIELPAEGASLRTSQLGDLNTVLLGLTTKPVSSFAVETDLFSHPSALCVVDVASIDQLPLSGKTYTIDTDRYDSSLVESSVSQVFGADRETVTVNQDGATGSQLAQAVSQATADETAIKTKFEPLRTELVQVYKLVAAVNAQTKLGKTGAPDLYRVSIRGLTTMSGSDDEINTAIHDVQKAVEALTAALVKAYGDQAVVEIVCESSAIQEKQNATEHHIVKREAAKSKSQVIRETYNVSVFTSSDYPAIFAIFAGLAILLAVAVLYIAVGIWNMDPGRDSIIYRMTTTRMKKD